MIIYSHTVRINQLGLVNKINMLNQAEKLNRNFTILTGLSYNNSLENTQPCE